MHRKAKCPSLDTRKTLATTPIQCWHFDYSCSCWLTVE